MRTEVRAPNFLLSKGEVCIGRFPVVIF
jgi:hypothetical protein